VLAGIETALSVVPLWSYLWEIRGGSDVDEGGDSFDYRELLFRYAWNVDAMYMRFAACFCRAVLCRSSPPASRQY
jgi:hypothetical protein